MENLLEFLIELANTPYQSDYRELIQKQSIEIQNAFLNNDACFIKQHLSNDPITYFANERSVVQL